MCFHKVKRNTNLGQNQINERHAISLMFYDITRFRNKCLKAKEDNNPNVIIVFFLHVMVELSVNGIIHVLYHFLKVLKILPEYCILL